MLAEPSLKMLRLHPFVTRALGGLDSVHSHDMDRRSISRRSSSTFSVRVSVAGRSRLASKNACPWVLAIPLQSPDAGTSIAVEPTLIESTSFEKVNIAFAIRFRFVIPTKTCTLSIKWLRSTFKSGMSLSLADRSRKSHCWSTSQTFRLSRFLRSESILGKNDHCRHDRPFNGSIFNFLY